ncbi:DUF2189 domain-containing protein [Roseomonas terrae]|jgi:uncharacterized membrane protein|uniref:DUF2189 domain-containing protein n=1 Tax=Neoroseomonas terrae TaxID=424799 RepID=A0ABS5EGP8_9PROT|nr:DUF2189 domain-containing protein [Neoroseomonas terrae]MBR0650177.1 DUF2189 domain-containing protein [Neoroseomonas terrae]
MVQAVLVSRDSQAHLAPIVRKIGLSDIRVALARGYADFNETPTQLVFLGIIYPIVGFVAARAASGGALLPLLYPLVAGLSLMGPVAALGIYELSRRREQGLPTTWLNAFDVLRSPAIGSIAALGVLMVAIFVAWLFAAQAVYRATMGEMLPGSFWALLSAVLTTSAGWRLILWGHVVGLFFAFIILSLTVVSFPLLLDRNVGVQVAVRTSIRAVLHNPIPMTAWGIVVAVLLALGCLPLFVGLAVVMPVLGHATWHLYRQVVEA